MIRQRGEQCGDKRQTKIHGWPRQGHQCISDSAHAEVLGVHRHGAPRDAHQSQSNQRHWAHVHHGGRCHVPKGPRGRVALPQGSPAVGQLMQGDGRDDPKQPANNDSVFAPLSILVHPHATDSNDVIAPRLFIMASVTDDPIVGIDLGTTHSLAAFCGEDGPRILGTDGLVPSVVRLGVDGAVGESARANAVLFPERTIHSSKRLLGRTFTEVEAEAGRFGFSVVAGSQGLAAIEGPDGQVVTPEEIAAKVLGVLREQAETDLGVPVRRAVVTVPAWFDDAQRQSVRDAGRLAGLDIVRLVNEPTAAALAYGLGKNAGTVLVFDLGGGTFDASVLQLVGSEDERFFRVLSTKGDTQLGGDDLDGIVMDHVTALIEERFGSVKFPPAARQALRLFAESARIRLSAEETATIQLDLGEGRVFQETLTRDWFEEQANPVVQRAVACAKEAVRDAGVDPANIDRVIMVGGTTRTPLVRRLVADAFQTEPYVALDPDRVVALGASVQAAILAGTNPGLLLLDVIPLSLGIETRGGGVAKLIMRNSAVPAQATEMFSTSEDGQVNIALRVLQGEREMAQDCRLLADFELSGLPPMPAGIPQVEVEFLVDADGILSVRAVERRSGKRASVQVAARHGLSRAEVDRMEEESLTFAKSDMQLHRVADLVVQAGLDAKWTREAMGRVADLEPAYREELERHLSTIAEFVTQGKGDPKSVDAQKFAEARELLDQTAMRLHELAIAASLRDESAGE